MILIGIASLIMLLIIIEHSCTSHSNQVLKEKNMKNQLRIS